jgi:hypothetical protein
MPLREDVRRAKETHADQLLEKPNVVGVGVGYRNTAGQKTDELAVLVLVTKKLPESQLAESALVPRAVNSVPTDVIEVGHIRAFQSHTDRLRPAPGGISIGHYLITAGTFGSVVRDRATGERLILSNNHVLANSNNAQVGDPILQPGPYDGGSQPADTIATLARFCPIQFGNETSTCSLANAYAGVGNFIANLLGSNHRLEVVRANQQAVNLVDAAVARPLSQADVLDEIMGIGTVHGTVDAELAMQVRKSGRTTGFTVGEITVLDATVSVDYGVGQTATFENQIVAGPMSQGGDSGSLVVTGDPPLAIGLLFAGSEQTTILNPIQAVLDCLQVDFIQASTSVQSPVDAFTENAGNSGGVSIERAQEVARHYQNQLMGKPNVVGVGVGQIQRGGQTTGQIGVVVMVEEKLPLTQLKADEVVPRELDGVPVDVQQIGKLRAF